MLGSQVCQLALRLLPSADVLPAPAVTYLVFGEVVVILKPLHRLLCQIAIWLQRRQRLQEGAPAQAAK